MTQERATHTLREEHQLILRVVARLQEIMEPSNGAAPDLDAVEDCLSFFRLFVDACHHGQEEDLLFEELAGAGMPKTTGPIAVMLHEHQIGRGLVRRMSEAMVGARAGADDAIERLRATSLDYVALIRSHIAKEDGVLFAHADHFLSEPACARLCVGYEASCSRRFDGCTKAQLEALAERVIAGASSA